MLSPTGFELIKRNGRTTPARFGIERRTLVSKRMPAVPSEPQLSRDPPSAQTELERIGFGWAQVKITVLVSAVWFAYHLTLNFSYLTADVISKEFELSPVQKGLLSSTIQAGCLFGNLCSGVSMQWGRRPVVLVSLMGTAIFLWSTAACSDYFLLIGTRFASGVFIGVGLPATLLLTTECSPIAWRAVVTSFVISGASPGEQFAELLVGQDNSDLGSIDWRRDAWLACLPVFGMGVLAYLFLYESPIYAAVSGKTEEAMTILEHMAQDNAPSVLVRGVQKPANSTAAETSPLSVDMFLRKAQVVFGPKLLYTTFVFMYSLSAFNLLMIGGGYAYPQVLAEDDAKSPAYFLLFASVAGTFGMPILVIIVYACRRKTAVAVYATLAVGSCAAIGYSSRIGRLGTVQIGVVLAKQATTLGGWIVPQYAAELYPSSVRAHGTAICMAGGKLGGMLGPVLFEWLAQVSYAGAFFYCIAILTVPSLVLVILLPVDTATTMLEDDVPLEVNSGK